MPVRWQVKPTLISEVCTPLVYISFKGVEKVTFSKKFYYGSVRVTENFFKRVSWQETFSEVSISVTFCHYVLDRQISTYITFAALVSCSSILHSIGLGQSGVTNS